MAAEQNTYLTESSGRRRGAHFATPPAPEPPERRWPKALLALALLVVIGGGAFFGWRAFGAELLSRLGIGGRTIEVTVDGKTTRVAEASSVQDVYETLKPAVAPGDLVSLQGNVLGKGEGNAFAATLDGQEVPYEEAASTRVAEGASLTFADGADASEDYTSEIVVTSTPKLVREVQEGTDDSAIQQGVVQYVYQWGKQGTKEVRTGSISGESADGDVVEGQDCIIMCQNINPDNGEKLVALTFDDGPGIYTERYLQILEKYGIKATFNLIGEQVDDWPDLMKANSVSGNQLTSHTWDHPELTSLSQEQLLAQLDKTFEAIESSTGYQTTTIRAPYGSINVDVWLKSQGHMSLSVCWSHDSQDWQLPGVDTIVTNCTSTMAPGSVILMHDAGGDREQGLEALPRIIEAWQNAGYRFVTMEELMASDSSIPADCRSGYRPMPEDAVWPTEIAS